MKILIVGLGVIGGGYAMALKEAGYSEVYGIDTNEEIIDESIVTTTGLGGVFPSGILVGKVVGVTKDNFDLATTVLVKSEIDFNDINFVTVLKRVEGWI